MKIKSLTALIALLFITCTKENNNRISDTNTSNLITQDDTPVPLNDLGTGTFMGYEGGLYPNGINVASGTYATDLLKKSRSIQPIDTFGNQSASGQIVFISIGGSTGGHNMKLLRMKTIGNPATNPALKLFNCNNGSGEASLANIMDTTNDYWNHITESIKGSRSSYRQVQVIYLETDDSNTYVEWPGRPLEVKEKIESCLRVFKQKFQNIKIVYVLGRTRTFGSKAIWNREPSPYYFGWSCKWAIEDQINGVPGTKYKGKKAVAPMLAWGFYQWADSLPRTTDGFYWRSSETADGLHANLDGEDTLSTRFQKFLLTDKYAKKWYAAP
ncbi:MAG: hypothetical protein ABI405_06685 [Parafilimonas sp.]